MRLLKWGSKMPSTKQYNLVTNDDYDTRIPLHPDEAFQYGITFHAKVSFHLVNFIGRKDYQLFIVLVIKSNQHYNSRLEHIIS